MDKELIVVKGKVIEQTKGYHAGIGKDSGYEAGAKMIKRHFDQNPDDVVAHFMGRDIVEAILAQPGCVGIRMFHGLNEIGIRQLILVGVEENGKNILEYSEPNSKTVKHRGIVADNTKPCPPYCDGTSTETSTSTGWY